MKRDRSASAGTRLFIWTVLVFLAAAGMTPVATQAAAFKHCKAQEGMGIMSDDSVVFCSKVYGRNKIQAQIDVLQRAVRVFDERCATHLNCGGMQRKVVVDEMKCLSSRRFSANCERRVGLQVVRKPLKGKLDPNDSRLKELTQLILDDRMEQARDLALELANSLVSEYADYTSFEPLLKLSADIEMRPSKKRQLQNVPGSKEVNRFRLVSGSLLDRFYQKRGRLPTRTEFSDKVEGSNIRGVYGIESYELPGSKTAAMTVTIASSQEHFAHQHEVEEVKPKLSNRRKVTQHARRLQNPEPDTRVYVVQYDDYVVFMTTRGQDFDYKTYAVLEKKESDWLVGELKGQGASIQPTVLRRAENYESRLAGYCAVDKERAHYLDFVNAAASDPTSIRDMKSISEHYPRFASEPGDEAILKKLAASGSGDARLFRYPNQGYLAEKNYIVGYEGPLVVAIQEITESLANQIEATFPDNVETHDYREAGLSNYRLTPCYLSGQYKTHHLIWRDMGLFPVGAPYAKRLFQMKNVALTLDEERVAEKGLLCRILENKNFPNAFAPAMESSIREAAELDCDADASRFLATFPTDSTQQSIQMVRRLYDQE